MNIEIAGHVDILYLTLAKMYTSVHFAILSVQTNMNVGRYADLRIV
jgi:hypothetical protein